MKLIFIHGMPAVGKLTVATELAKLTGFNLFHNHYSVDLVKSVFPWGTKEFSELNRKIRLDMFEAAAKNNINGIIFTFCFRPNKNDEFIKNVIDTVKRHGGEVNFIYLKCDTDELYRRVEHENRKKYKKITSVTEIKEHINMWGEIPFTKNLVIDNTNLSPEKTAKLIIDNFKLQ